MQAGALLQLYSARGQDSGAWKRGAKSAEEVARADGAELQQLRRQEGTASPSVAKGRLVLAVHRTQRAHPRHVSRNLS